MGLFSRRPEQRAAEFALILLRVAETVWKPDFCPTTISRRSRRPEGGEDRCGRVRHTMGADGAADDWKPRGSARTDVAGGGERRKDILCSF